jgi:hypothetical protein
MSRPPRMFHFDRYFRSLLPITTVSIYCFDLLVLIYGLGGTEALACVTISMRVPLSR